jgi:hypothetical protein
LFAFTYLWIAANQFLNAGNHAFGWFCFFIAVTRTPDIGRSFMRGLGVI